MRYALLLLVCAPFAFFAACGGDDSTTSNQDAGEDGSKKDTSVPADGGADAPVDDASDAAPLDAADATVIDLQCMDPSTCEAGAAPICCANLVTGPGTFPCPVKTLTSMCASSCTTNVMLACNTTETVRLCGKTADCTESGYPACCTFKQGSQNVTFCVPTATKAFATSCFP